MAEDRTVGYYWTVGDTTTSLLYWHLPEKLVSPAGCKTSEDRVLVRTKTTRKMVEHTNARHNHNEQEMQERNAFVGEIRG